MGVPTYKRPDELDRALRSLVMQESSPKFDICIIDNDPTGSARKIAGNYAKDLHITYLTELRPGVVHVRNRLLMEAGSYDFLAFLDDDEVAATNWLAELRSAFEKYPNAVIAGRVDYCLSDKLQCSELAQLTFRRPSTHSGAVLRTTGTGNSAIPISSLSSEARSLRFDPKYSAVGGEDTQYFSKLANLGYDIRAWPRARVSEIVPPDRSAPDVIRKRLRRSGHVNAMLALEEDSRAKVGVAYLARLVAGCLFSLTSIKKERRARAIALRQSGLGGLDAVLSVSRHYYGS
ncbi:glycosyltransferase family 2 protein [Dietzia maris]|uniref:glycosyltransferase family 2 protein n=1 Tax=Dietzia maris TaxID=37915 RepID=UPI003D7C8978